MLSTINSITDTPIRIVIADDHVIFREGLSWLFKNKSYIKIIGQAINGKELVQLVEEKAPDIVITDIMMPEMNGIEATKIITSKFPETGIIALTMLDNESIVLDMLEAGAKGYLLKTDNKEQILQAVLSVKARQTYYCSTASNKLIQFVGRSNFTHSKTGTKPHFTERELDIIRLICKEHCSKEIAYQLNINRRSVETARERIQEKIGAKNNDWHCSLCH